MKTIMMFVVAVGLAFSAVQAKTVNVFFAGGQSNARSEWSSAIASGLQAGYGSTLVMAAAGHAGNGLSQWFTTSPQANYSNDFCNAAGTGILQTQIRAITNAGDVAVFQGIFWFQGETDTGSYASMDAYTNRVGGMLAQLKQDLGMTNSIRFSYAVIDGNPDPYYDDPANTGGRTRADIDYLRSYQIAQGSGPQGIYVDTRGYTRTDMWHLTAAELTRLGTAMGVAYTNKFGISLPPAGTPVTVLDQYTETVEISSHDADGAIYGTGTFNGQDLICGSAAGSTEYNGIAFFRLPAANQIDSSDLVLTVQSGGTLPANLDVWGLGFMTTPVLNAAWRMMADTDTRTTLISGYPYAPAKIADNLVASNQAAVANSVWQLNGPQRTNLTAFLTSLFQRGAIPGDYAVIRVNPDASMASVTNPTISIRFGGSHRAPTTQSKLRVTYTDQPMFPAGTFKYFTHTNDGSVFSSGGYSIDNNLMSSTGGSGPQDYSGITFLALPEQRLTSSGITLTAAEVPGPLVGANVDVWGLGYVSSPQMNMSWLCTNDIDSRALLNGRPPVKLADNIVTSGQSVAVGAVWQPTAAQSNDLRRYLNGLFERHAKPGDYAVIRVNMDASQAGFYRGVRWGASGATSPSDRRAFLSGSFSATTNYLVDGGFEAGSGSALSNWTVVSNGFLGQLTNESVRNGWSTFRMSVNGNQAGNTNDNLNIYQDVISADLPGKVVTLSGYVRHNSGEPLATNSNQKVEFKLWWVYDGSVGSAVSSRDPLLPAEPKNIYKMMLVAGTVPTNAIGVRAQVVFSTGTVANPAITNGAALVEDLRLTVFVPPPPVGTLMGVR